MNLTVTFPPNKILHVFNIGEEFEIIPIPTGHINLTFKVIGAEKSFVLQRVNKTIFTKPDRIANNIKLASDHLKKHHPEYLFLSSIKTNEGNEMEYDDEGFPWRLFPFIEDTFTMDSVESPEQAFSAAQEFGRLTCYLNECDVSKFEPTLDRFHDLTWRYEQFENALNNASPERVEKAKKIIEQSSRFAYLVDDYETLIASGDLVSRVMHNDTKINNILFNKNTNKAVCVIDLDTLMPGYFIYDVGDMIRTFVSPVSEEESDLSKITIREPILDALTKGYLSQMGDVLKEKEKTLIPFGGMMMTYIMGLRFLADFLNGDVYYHTTYPGQNLVRASNQFHFLNLLAKYN